MSGEEAVRAAVGEAELGLAMFAVLFGVIIVYLTYELVYRPTIESFGGES
jgi:hypothetical protein